MCFGVPTDQIVDFCRGSLDRACSVKLSFQYLARQHKAVIRKWSPQGMRDLFNRWTGNAIRYRGVYPDWESAVRAAGGYADEALFTCLEAAALSVNRGEAAWEQDGVVYDRVLDHSQMLLCIARVALSRGGRLSVLDYGGALGSTYRQCQATLPEVSYLQWCIVEQPRFVASGRRHFQTSELVFEDSLERALRHGTPDAVILSSVLQYLKDPYGLLQSLMNVQIEYLIVDRHPCSMTDEVLTVQVVPRRLYAASYPSWLFDESKFASQLGEQYDLLTEWEGKDPPIRGPGIGATFKGSFWRRRTQA
ncbi:MAG: hypothetical protein NFCOHLIN_02926 [Gammaproteobacteria bacterium]|nr:hypothetical protein [Gammaproteobacteria bacterium]